MRAFMLDSLEGRPALRDDAPTPAPGAQELLVRVRASSVNPVDAAIAAGMLQGMFEHELPVTLGRDFAGVVEDIGPGVGRHGPGDAVFGFVPHADATVHAGSWADYAVASEAGVAAIPAGVDVAAAGAAPVAALTALAAYDALDLSAGGTVLVVGATGGVGSVFLQLAAAAGATVLATGFADDREYLGRLGAAEIVDRDGDVAMQVRELRPEGVDALLDLVSREPDASVLREGGRLASPLGAAGDGPGRTNVRASSTTQNLERLAGLLAAGDLSVPIQRTYSLDEAGSALDALTGEHSQGKLAIAIA